MEKKELDKLREQVVGKTLLLDDYKFGGKAGKHALSDRTIQVVDLVERDGSLELAYQLGDPRQSNDLGRRTLKLPAEAKFGRNKLSFEEKIDDQVANYSFSYLDPNAEPAEEDAKAPAKADPEAGKPLEEKQALPVQPGDNAANRK